MKLYTIGFAKKSAKEFFELLKKHQIKRMIDVRESNTNIYAGFTMKQNFPYFLEQICGIEYLELKILAPAKELRDEYHESGYNDWDTYEKGYLTSLDDRKVSERLDSEILEDAVLLCSEPTAENCHRRLAAEYLQKIYKDIEIIHL